MHSFEVHSKERERRKSGCLGLEQVILNAFKNTQSISSTPLLMVKYVMSATKLNPDNKIGKIYTKKY